MRLGLSMRGERPRLRRPLLSVCLSAAGIAVVVLVVAGVFSGPASTGAQPAAAAVLRGAAAALVVLR